MADFSQKNLKKCKRIFHIFIIYYNTDGCKNEKISFFFRPRAAGRIWQTANIASGNTVVVVGTMCTSSLRPYKTEKYCPIHGDSRGGNQRNVKNEKRPPFGSLMVGYHVFL